MTSYGMSSAAPAPQHAPPAPISSGPAPSPVVAEDRQASTVSNNNNTVASRLGSSSDFSSNRTLKFLRAIMGSRRADYCSEAPQPAPAQRRAAQPQQQPLQHQQSVQAIQQQQDASASRGISACCPRWLCLPQESRRALILSILDSGWYKALLILLTFILLFGAQIRFIAIPSSGDVAMDVVYMTTFTLFWIDIFMRIDAEANYFPFNLCGLKSSRNPSLVTHQNSNGTCCPNFVVGSFLFWCDLISTVTVLYEVSFTNPTYFSEVAVAVTLDSFGVPEGGVDAINKPFPVGANLALLVTIGKTARCARFIRSSTAIKISSKVNWNGLINLFDPCWWWNHRICRRSANNMAPSGYPSSGMSMGTAGAGRGGVIGLQSRNLKNNRSNSWGRLALFKVSAARVERSERESEKTRVLSFTSAALVFLGFKKGGPDLLTQEIAATKIQRAWRHGYYKQQDTFESHSSLGVAWHGRSRSRRMVTDNPVDNALMKRSFVTRYNNINSRSLKAPQAKSIANATLSDRSGTGSSGSIVKPRSESQVGTAMRELTGQRVAIGIIIALCLTVLFTYIEQDTTRPSTMIVLYNQTGNPEFANRSLDAARSSSIPDLFYYQFTNGENRTWSVAEAQNPLETLRPREMYNVTVNGTTGMTVGVFAYKNERVEQAWVSIFSTLFILLVWFFGVTAFAGPVMVLVVIPIERMVRLLAMIMLDPLGYENTARYKRFMDEEDDISKTTRWKKEVLKGMETSFLMSTILRIGSLMKVGFGSAGVEIIRNNLEKGHGKNMLMLSSQGSSVSCIFLFSDIRQFTDATECLQEEVFVFTNRIAAVVHSICHSYGGSANKNIGDAFLLSWLLDEEGDGGLTSRGSVKTGSFTAKHNQADKALLSVVKICMSLHYDDFYIQGMSKGAREALMTKLAKRKGPIVQMGFGLHAGKAVQGAIGSQRKIDATYVSEHVERAEFLESSTKQYGVNMIMSDSFHRLLHPANRRRCRKIDQILIQDEDDAEDDYLTSDGKLVELLTFDMDIDALWRGKPVPDKKTAAQPEPGHETDSEMGSERGAKKEPVPRRSGGMLRRISQVRLPAKDGSSDEFSEVFTAPTEKKDNKLSPTSELVLPSGPALYNANVWGCDDMRKIRQKYSEGLFFPKFNQGLKSFYERDWEHARQCFVTVLDLFEDGPSRYFLNQIEKHNGVPPRDFKRYGVAS